MRIIGYILLGLVSYLVFMVLLFPASPVIKRLQTAPLVLNGVSGPLWNGEVAQVVTPNTLMPTGPDDFLLENISWRLAPQKLLSGAGAANIAFSAYGGSGKGLVSRQLDGDTTISGLYYSSNGESLNVLFDPLLKIAGELKLNVAEAVVKNQLLESLDGDLEWNNAVLDVPVVAKLGNLKLTVKPRDEDHIAEITSTGGDLELSGSVDLKKDGNFKTDITIVPRPSASVVLTDMLRGLARPNSDGSFRLRRNGNINRLFN